VESAVGADRWIDALELRRHHEGGWFREVYRSAETIPHGSLPNRFTGDRQFSTAIYFLLECRDFSALHRIKQDEIWHFYDGAPLTIHMIDTAGEYSSLTLGRKAEADQRLVAVVAAGTLFGATVDEREGFALVGCTVAPGFDFDDFEMPDRAQLLDCYPQHRRLIMSLTRAP